VSICLKDLGIVCSIGLSKQSVMQHLVTGTERGLQQNVELPLGDAQYVGRVAIEDDELANVSNRNNKLAKLAYEQIADTINTALSYCDVIS